MRKAKPVPVDEGIIRRFQENVCPEPNSGCWLWMGYFGHNGYGSFHIQGGAYRAHRVAYAIEHGEISPSLVIDHLCRNRACVNPCHLELVTHGENVARGDSKKTHCKRGHPLNGEDVRITVRGLRTIRKCRICEKEDGQKRSEYFASRRRLMAKASSVLEGEKT